MKLKKLISESWLDEPKKLSKEEKKAFLDEVSTYGTFGEAIYSKHNLVEIAKKLMKLADQAEVIALTESGADFDQLTVKRNFKELKGLCKEFGKSAIESQQLRRRLESLYEDAGNILGRYYDIKEINEEVGDMLGTTNGQDPYDGFNATSPLKNEVTDQQKVNNNIGLNPYDLWKSEENESDRTK
jgi:hypothetical protein